VPFHPSASGLARVAAAMALLGLAACGTPPAATFDLIAPPISKSLPGRSQVVVVEPAALQLINSDRIIVRPKDGQVSYLSGAQWADRLPSLIQARLIQTFENGHRVGSVGRPEDKLTADATLVTEIRTFEIDASQGSTAVVEIAARLVNEGTGRIVSAQLFKASVPAAGTSGPQASAALDTALQSVLRDIVVWVSARA
jgi:cholesterol transport system auxiliary component